MVGMTSYEPSFVPTLTLNDGTELPAIGFGTWKLRGAEAIAAVRSAIEVGYRHIDTAVIYGNEKEVGTAIRDAIAAGDVTRDALFVTTKVWHDHHGSTLVKESFQQSLTALGLDYIDCLMVHWPWPQGGKYVESFEALAKLQGLGQLQSVAVANFYPAVLDEIIEATGIAPVINQVELHPGFSQSELRAYHQSHGIVTEAWSPLGRGECLADPVVTSIAEKLGKTPAQIVLAWLTQLGCSVVPKSANRARQEENFDIFSFALDDEQMRAITALDETGGRMFASPLEFPGEE